jgi:hypothetical protein
MSAPAIDVISERLSRITQWLDACGGVLRVAATMVAYVASVLRGGGATPRGQRRSATAIRAA